MLNLLLAFGVDRVRLQLKRGLPRFARLNDAMLRDAEFHIISQLNVASGPLTFSPSQLSKCRCVLCTGKSQHNFAFNSICDTYFKSTATTIILSSGSLVPRCASSPLCREAPACVHYLRSAAKIAMLSLYASSSQCRFTLSAACRVNIETSQCVTQRGAKQAET